MDNPTLALFARRQQQLRLQQSNKQQSLIIGVMYQGESHPDDPLSRCRELAHIYRLGHKRGTLA